MSVVADFSVPVDAFCLGETLHAVPTAVAELDRLVAYSPDHVMPFVWIIDTEQARFEAAVAEDSTVETATVTDSFENDTYLYQISWTETVGDRLHSILDHDGVLLDARGTTEHWRLWVRFGERAHFSRFQEHFEAFGTVTLHHLTSPQTPGGIQYGVSAKQRDALLTAYDMGYFETPSTATGDDVAHELGISQQSVSRRLRRGINALIGSTLDRHRDE